MLTIVYIQPIWLIVVEISVMIGLWSVVTWVGNWASWHKIWKELNLCLFLLSTFLVLYATIFNRSEGDSEICLIPFYSFVLAREQTEIYRSMLMNVFLFVPFGLTLSQILPEQWGSGKRMMIAICAGLLLSCFAEGMQYMFSLGRGEIDDVLTNVLGTGIGTGGIYMGGRFLEKCRRAW